jgi:hypothetical protein
MLDRALGQPVVRLEYLGPIDTPPAPLGPVGQVLDTVDIWLAGTLQSLFGLIRR